VSRPPSPAPRVICPGPTNPFKVKAILDSGRTSQHGCLPALSLVGMRKVSVGEAGNISLPFFPFFHKHNAKQDEEGVVQHCITTAQSQLMNFSAFIPPQTYCYDTIRLFL
jgi:hypothetical protein